MLDILEMLSNRYESRLYTSGEERYYVNRKRVSMEYYMDNILSAIHREVFRNRDN